MNGGTDAGAMPAKVSVKSRGRSVTAGLANEVEEVKQ